MCGLCRCCGLSCKAHGFKSKAFMLTYNSRSFTTEVWEAFRSFARDLAKQLGARAWSACVELSTKGQQTTVHTHAYFFWTDGVGYRTDNLDDLGFQGVRPRVDQCVAGASVARSPRRSALHGMYYVSVVKLGTVASDTNFVPWRDYTPSRQWLVSLYDSQKLTDKQFLNLSAHRDVRRPGTMDLVTPGLGCPLISAGPKQADHCLLGPSLPSAHLSSLLPTHRFYWPAFHIQSQPLNSGGQALSLCLPGQHGLDEAAPAWTARSTGRQCRVGQYHVRPTVANTDRNNVSIRRRNIPGRVSLRTCRAKARCAGGVQRQI